MITDRWIVLRKPTRVRGQMYRAGVVKLVESNAALGLVARGEASYCEPPNSPVPENPASKPKPHSAWPELRALPHQDARDAVEKITGKPSPQGWDALEQHYLDHLKSQET